MTKIVHSNTSTVASLVMRQIWLKLLANLNLNLNRIFLKPYSFSRKQKCIWLPQGRSTFYEVFFTKYWFLKWWLPFIGTVKFLVNFKWSREPVCSTQTLYSKNISPPGSSGWQCGMWNIVSAHVINYLAVRCNISGELLCQRGKHICVSRYLHIIFNLQSHLFCTHPHIHEASLAPTHVSHSFC